MSNRAEFATAMCEAFGLNGLQVQELTVRLKPYCLIEVEAQILVIDGSKVETLFREYRFEAVPK